MDEFSSLLLDWFKVYGRKNLPWQHDTTPYRVWVSEIMLQQTQVKTVIPYYSRFIKHFPDIKALAYSSIDDVLAHWTGLGYYARARNLHKTAQIIEFDYQAKFPSNLEQLDLLPGIGLSTAGAILSLSMGKHAAILDGNCKRVYARCFKVPGYAASIKVQKELWSLAEHLTPKKNSAQYNQAIMDLGSIICTRTTPACVQHTELCPVSKICQAFNSDTIANYPQKKRVKKTKEKSAVFIIILAENKQQQQVVLEKRPPTGIWGGLWCFPEFANERQCIQWLVLNYPEYVLLKKIPTQQHIFSHYRLNYSVLVIQAKIVNEMNDGGKSKLFSLQQSLQLGLATPIKKLLVLADNKQLV